MAFKSGQSGNPKGRPPGVGKVAKYRKLLQSQAEDLIQVVIRQALAGEPFALKMCLDRLIPPYRPEAIPAPFDLPEEGGPRAICEAIIKQVATGTLSAEKGVQIVRILGWQEKIIENLPTGIVSDEPEPLSEEEFCARHGIERDV